MLAVVVAVAEQAHAQLVVLEQEAAEIRLKGLDADADGVEIVAVSDIADVIVDEGFLQRHDAVEPVRRLGRIDIEDAALGDLGVIDVGGDGEAEFDLRRLEGGRALIEVRRRAMKVWV